MKLGYFMMPLHHINRDYHETLEEDMEAIIYADQLGYSEAWVGEHYSSAVEQITSPLMFHANLISRTKQIQACHWGYVPTPISSGSDRWPGGDV